MVQVLSLRYFTRCGKNTVVSLRKSTLHAAMRQSPSTRSQSIDSGSRHKKQGTLESRQVINSRPKWPIGLLVRIVPILAAAAAIAINLRGYSIGTQFVGVLDST